METENSGSGMTQPVRLPGRKQAVIVRTGNPLPSNDRRPPFWIDCAVCCLTMPTALNVARGHTTASGLGFLSF